LEVRGSYYPSSLASLAPYKPVEEGVLLPCLAQSFAVEVFVRGTSETLLVSAIGLTLDFKAWRTMVRQQALNDEKPLS